jgi:hypothetical protein
MDYVNILQDSVATSVYMKLFKTKEEASFAHIFKSTLVKVPLSLFKEVDNFNPQRLQSSAVEAYPPDNRPRGNNDLLAVKFYQKQLRQGMDIAPIWMVKDKQYILIDGAHRVVASHIEHKKFIYAYVIKN